MGRRREILKRIAAHERMVAEHEEKIAAELQKSSPDERLIAVWRKQIANAQAHIAKLRLRLTGR